MHVTIRPLGEKDLAEADRIFRAAFGTFLGLPDPATFGGDTDFVRTRWQADPLATIGAYSKGELVGSNFVTRWGSFGFFGPLTVRPDLWEHGVAQSLMRATIQIFDTWRVPQTALFTFSHSTKHVWLYQKFGYWPQSLTPVMAKQVEHPKKANDWSVYSALPPAGQEHCLVECAELTGSIMPGLDLEREIRVLKDQNIGDTLLLRDGDRLVGMAVCHIGKGSEAGSGATYIKFGGVRPGTDAPHMFDRLLRACEDMARHRDAPRLVAGVNTARHGAYRQMIERGFRTMMQGVAMQRPNEPGYNRPDCFVMDDWR